VPLDNRRRGEDQVCGFRCALLGRIACVPEILRHRRFHGSNLTALADLPSSVSELRSGYSGSQREAVLVPLAMRHVLTQLVRTGAVSDARAHPLFPALAEHARRLKTLRVIECLPMIRK
jgi:hypothetical protein